MLERFRGFWGGLFTPVAKMLLRWGVSPDTVTIVGTAGVCFGALWFFPRGELWLGVVVVTAFVFSDMVDGLMARLSERSSNWGAFLDSTLDRFGDAAIFGGLVMYYVGPGDSGLLAALALYCLVMGSLTSYARARAEALGMHARVGIAERSDRLVAILVMTFFADVLGLLVLIPVTLGVLALASTVTVVQRVRAVHEQTTAAA
jgi:CDP-diacylglycerol--glycerol-3-phosphate 3-phosphatidyltransferase